MITNQHCGINIPRYNRWHSLFGAIAICQALLLPSYAIAQATGGTGGAGGAAGAGAPPTTPGAVGVPVPQPGGPNTPTPVPNTPTPTPNTPTSPPNALSPSNLTPLPLPQSPSPPTNPVPGNAPSANPNGVSPTNPNGIPTGRMFYPNSRFTPNSRFRPNTSSVPTEFEHRSGALGGAAAAPNVGTSPTTNGIPLQLGSELAASFGRHANLGLSLSSAGNRMQISALDNSAVGAAGFQVGDQVLAVNKTWVGSPQEMQNHLAVALRNEGRAWVYVNRGGTPQWIDVDLTGRSRGMLGVRVLDQSGAVTLSGIYPGSFAFRAGLQPGDQVVSVNGVSVHTSDDLINQVRAAATGNGELSLEVRRNGALQTIETSVAARGGLATQGGGAPGLRAAAKVDLPPAEQLDRLRVRAEGLRDLLGNLSTESGSLTPQQIQEAQAAANELARIVQQLNQQSQTR